MFVPDFATLIFGRFQSKIIFIAFVDLKYAFSGDNRPHFSMFTQSCSLTNASHAFFTPKYAYREENILDGVASFSPSPS